MNGANDCNKDTAHADLFKERVRDYFKNEIKVGDMVVYPNRQGSSLWMNHGWVTAVGWKPKYSYKLDGTQVPVITVKKVITNYVGKVMGYKEVQLTCLDRVIALGRYPVVFTPRKAKDEFRTTWLDRVMQWLRTKIHRG